MTTEPRKMTDEELESLNAAYRGREISPRDEDAANEVKLLQHIAWQSARIAELEEQAFDEVLRDHARDGDQAAARQLIERLEARCKAALAAAGKGSE